MQEKKFQFFTDIKNPEARTEIFFLWKNSKGYTPAQAYHWWLKLQSGTATLRCENIKVGNSESQTNTPIL